VESGVEHSLVPGGPGVVVTGRIRPAAQSNADDGDPAPRPVRVIRAGRLRPTVVPSGNRPVAGRLAAAGSTASAASRGRPQEEVLSMTNTPPNDVPTTAPTVPVSLPPAPRVSPEVQRARHASEVATTDGVPPPSTPASAWRRWIVFAGVILVIAGVYEAVEGLVALLNPAFYGVPGGSLPVAGYAVWGWVHLVIGVCVVLTGVGLVTGSGVARFVAAFLAMVSALVNLAFVGVAPVWSVIVIAFDVLVIYAITVHGEELAPRR
jgi:hypothetical protein